MAASGPDSNHPPDLVSGPFSDGLEGRTFEYSYPSGIRYRISFSKDTAFFKNLPHGNVPARSNKILSLPYRARELREDLYLAHWLLPDRSGHITLIFDLQKNEVNCASLMPGKFELFEIASLDVALTHGEGALYHEEDIE